MTQIGLFDQPAPAREVATCPRCRCCDAVDGVCLGECHANGHRINRNGSAPQQGGWVDLDSALAAAHPNDTEAAA